MPEEDGGQVFNLLNGGQIAVCRESRERLIEKNKIINKGLKMQSLY